MLEWGEGEDGEKETAFLEGPTGKGEEEEEDARVESKFQGAFSNAVGVFFGNGSKFQANCKHGRKEREREKKIF